MMILANIGSSLPGDVGRYVLLAVGLGFVVFFHELGHFLAAKYCGVLVEQFAVGFGPAVVAWRKGIGLRAGGTMPEVQRRVDAHLGSHRVGDSASEPTSQQITRAMADLHLGETEYRLNWIPLGGYVKMLGQDDLHPDAHSTDPRAFNNGSIGGRMLIISAGVMMNVLLAAIGFMVVFLIGMKSAPAEVGGVLVGSPASFATADDGSRSPLQVGDQIVYFDGKYQHNFENVALTVALVREGESVPMLVRRVDGRQQTLHVIPSRSDGDAQGLLSIGVLPPMSLHGPDASEPADDDIANPRLFPPDMRAVKAGEAITAINDSPVGSTAQSDDYWKLDQALTQSDGRPVTLTVRSADGALRQEQVLPHFQTPYSREDISLAGMTPRARVALLVPESPAVGQLRPDDVIEAVADDSDHVVIQDPSPDELKDAINSAGQRNVPIVLTVLDPDGTTRQTSPIIPSAKLPDDRRGLDIQLGSDEQNTIVAGVVADSAAAKAGIKPGSSLIAVGGEPVGNWFQVRRLLAGASAGEPIAVQLASAAGGNPVTCQLTLSQDEIDAMKYLTVTTDLASVLQERIELRKTKSPLIAAEWGAAETRNFILQFYVTLRRMYAGSVSYKQAMGPVGIIHFGAMSAQRGADMLIWFLSMISANLAVANFLPIPVMDGGLFVLLILEAIQGRPLSMKTQQRIQMIGLALILSIFLLVTYQDIARLFRLG
jgi:regulator of sigma E protease